MHMRRFFYGLVALVGLMVVVGSWVSVFDHQPALQQDMIPAHVKGAADVARRAIPGWNRAEAQGLIVPLGITAPVRTTQATITLEQAWYSARQVYVVYTVQAADGQYILPTTAYVTTGKTFLSQGQTDWMHLSLWGGFSKAGFHGVLVFSGFNQPPGPEGLTLTIRQWAPVSARTGLEQSKTAGREISLSLPWRAEFLASPAPDIRPLTQRQMWLGRTLALGELRVEIGRIQLSGWVELPPGESDPGLLARLLVGGEVRELKEYKADKATEPGRYHFSAVFDGPNQWPAPVKLELSGLNFLTHQTLEWPVNWAKYRNVSGGDHRLMDAADQVTVKFFNSTLTSIFAHQGGVSIEQKETGVQPPYVRAMIGGARGIGGDRPGFELVNDSGEVLTNFGGGGGVIWSSADSRDVRYGVSTNWALPEAFGQSNRLLLRYVDPGATMVLKESWTLGGGK